MRKYSPDDSLNLFYELIVDDIYDSLHFLESYKDSKKIENLIFCFPQYLDIFQSKIKLYKAENHFYDKFDKLKTFQRYLSKYSSEEASFSQLRILAEDKFNLDLRSYQELQRDENKYH